MDLGSTLRDARERRGLSLTQLSSTTKIPLTQLEAMEANVFELVPPGIFLRGFLRAYAREVGLDPRQIIDQFAAEHGSEMPPPVETPASITAPDDGDDARFADTDLSGSGSAWSSLAVVIALIIAVVGIHRFNNTETGTTVDQTGLAAGVSALDAAAAGAAGPVATSGQAMSEVAVSTPTGLPGGRFQIHAQGPCWVEAVVDGRKIVYRLMQPGERASIDPEHELVLRVGDPAALTYFVDGTPGEPLGERGVPVTVRFTSEGRRIARAS
jgi:cytoskeleton protein RodZ